MRGKRPARATGIVLAFLLLPWAAEGRAQNLDWGGSLRGYQFLRASDLPPIFGRRRDAEFLTLRLTLKAKAGSHLRLQAHAVLDELSPRAASASRLATGRSSTFLPLEHTFTGAHSSSDLVGRFDRLNLALDFERWRLVLGRQAISWGVARFWPALDLFSSFAPQRIDREYKEGVDAARLILSLSSTSQLQVAVSSLGPSASDDGAAAAQLRLGLGSVDLGFVGGKFHRDTVAGLFFTSDLQGTGWHGEVAWTRSGDPEDRARDRRVFWRASLGADRQLSPDVGLTFELAYNGFGVGSATGYASLARADRVRRGEVAALGTYYAGVALSWQLHPLWRLTSTLLVNGQDPSAFWIPALEWSTSENTSLLLALEQGFGRGFEADLSPGSEYGVVPSTLLLAARWYF